MSSSALSVFLLYGIITIFRVFRVPVLSNVILCKGLSKGFAG
jgi:hypothetical protein